jgi:uracil phosphoribosyltransferase
MIRKIYKRKQEAILNKIEYIKDSNSTKTQFRSLRKTFADKMLSQVYGKNDTELNKKRLIGHTENTESQRYVGRLEPSIAYEIINAFDWSEINFDEIKDTVKSYYHNINEEILYDLPWLNNHNEDWKIVTTFKVKKSKGIKNSADNF